MMLGIQNNEIMLKTTYQSISSFRLLFQDIELKSNKQTCLITQSQKILFSFDIPMPPKCHIPLIRPSHQQQTSYHPIYNNIGALKSIWNNSKGRPRAINKGTAFLVSPRVLLTCSHNIYSDFLRCDADAIEFTAGRQEINAQNVGYKSTKKLIIKKDKNQKTFRVKTQKQELCLILLEREYKPLCQGLKIGNFEQVQLLEQFKVLKNQIVQSAHKLKIIGYPLEQNNRLQYLNSPSFRRQLEGECAGIEDYVIYHTMPTQPGFSGSPILAKDKQGQYFAVGIHTHRGIDDKPNSGLYFSSQILSKIKMFLNEINSSHNLTEQIKIENLDNKQEQEQDCNSEIDPNDYMGLLCPSKEIYL